MNTIENIDVLKKVDEKINNEPKVIDRDTFCKNLIEKINDEYMD